MKRIFGLGLLTGFLALASLGAATEKTALVTFTKDVAPIIQKNCQVCHRPGEIAPMSFMNYREIRPWARAIREAVTTRQMPPWFADPKHGEFSNDCRLSQKDIDTVVAWVEAGSREGDAGDLPPNPKFPEGWSIGKPDAVLSMTAEYHVPSNGV